MNQKIYKILFTLTPPFNPYAGGVQRTTFKLGKYFTEKGMDVSYYSTANHSQVNPEHGKLYYSPFQNGLVNKKNFADLQNRLEQIKPDFVINQMPYEKELRECLYLNKQKLNFILLGCLRNSLFSFKNNIREIAIHDLPQWTHTIVNTYFGEKFLQWQHWFKHRSYLRSIISMHDKFILLAPPNRMELQHFVGNYKADKVLSIPNSIPEIFYEYLNKEKIILHVGRIDIPQKRSDLLAKFWIKIYDKLPDWNFIIVGDGPYLSSLRKEIEDLKLPRVQLKGAQKPEEYYKKAAIFMMPSAFEGFPNTILEAQSYGCVPFAFNSYAALDWIVSDRENAILIKPFDVKLLAEEVIALANNKEMQIKLQRSSLFNASRFTIDKVGEQWFNLFESLLCLDEK